MSDHCDLDRLEALVYGELEPVEAERVRAHVETCATCRSERAWLETERAAMQERAAAQEPAAATLWGAVEAAIASDTRPAEPETRPPVDELAPRRLRRRTPRWIGAGIAVAAAAAVALILASGPDQPGAPATEPERAAAESAADAGGDDGDELAEARQAIAEAERAHVSAIDSLRTAYESRRDQLDPQVARVYDQRFGAAAELIASGKDAAGDDIETRWLLLDAYASHRRSLQRVLQEIEE